MASAIDSFIKKLDIKCFIAGAHVRQPEHGRVRVGAASRGPGQEDWRGSVVGAVWSEYLQVSPRIVLRSDIF